MTSHITGRAFEIYFFATADHNKMHFERKNGANDCFVLNITTSM
jgi:hypothetical protein